MKNFIKMIKLRLLKLLLFIIFISSIGNYLYGVENKIIFKINNNSFTSIDLEERINYLNFIGNDMYLDKEGTLQDYISANLFNQYHDNNFYNKNFENNVIKIYENIILERNNSNDVNIDNKFRDNILKNLRIDLIRKNILQEILNTKRNEIFNKEEELDLLYKINLKYISIKHRDKINLNNLNIENYNDLNDLEILLKDNKINYFKKIEEINDINEINNKIKINILKNKKNFVINENNIYTFFEIEKKFETLEGLIANIFTVETKSDIDIDNLKCQNLTNLNKVKFKVTKKEYEYKKLNEKIKKRLLEINDLILFSSENKDTYIILCGIKFDKEILQNINLNKKVDVIVKDIEKKFINKYSKIFNLILFDE